MVKSQLIQTLASKHRLSKDQANHAVDAVLGCIKTAMAEGDRVELRGFGTFLVKQRSAKTSRNPKTGATVQVPAKTVMAFKAGMQMRERVDN